MSNDILYELKTICQDLKLFGDNELLDIALCAYAAVSGSDKDKLHIDLSYTYIMRKLRKNDKKNVNKFQKVFKKTFDEALEDDEIDNPSEIALITAMKAINWSDNA